MATISYQVLQYSISMHRPLALNLGGQSVVTVATILCTGDLEHRLLVGFQPQGESPGINYYNSESKTAYLIRPQSEFQWYVDLLRHEKPISARIYGDTPAYIYLHTGPEPVGEGELRIPK
jgi:hypothetical protein